MCDERRITVFVMTFLLVLAMGVGSTWAQEEEEHEQEETQEAAQDEAGEDDDAGEEEDGERSPLDGPEVPDDPLLDEDEPQERSGIDGPRLPSADMAAPEGSDPEFEAELEAYRDAFGRYAATIQEYQDTIENMVQTEFDRRMAEISASYNPRIRTAEAVERQRRGDAIESLEDFLAEYGNDPDHTPDALFRLALLYDQREDDEYAQGMQHYFEQMDQTDDPDLMPESPQRSYEKSQAMFNRLIADWPDYRGIDLAYYFMAHIEWEQGNGDRARDMASELIRRKPDSEFVPHAWLMIGEFYFEDAEQDGPDHIRDNLLLALDAFKQAGSEEGRETLTDANFIRAIYSWAWSNYRLEDYPGAIKVFKDVIETIDGATERTGQRRDLLRDDAVGHLAEILAIEDWDLSGVPQTEDTVMSRVQEHLSDGTGYEREVLIRLGEELFGFLRFEEAIEVYEFVLAEDPLHPDNPEIHSRIVVALHRDFREEAAFAVRREMMDYYGNESAWYAHQERRGNEAAIRRADQMVRDYLLMAATWYHEQAQTTRNEALVRRDSAMVSLAEEQYAMAADSYREFLRQFPNDSEIFQWNFYYAETLYYSGQYDDAFAQYQVVRELDIPDNPFQEVSAFNAITALEYMMRERVNRGELTARALSGSDYDDARDTADDLGQQRELDEERSLQAVSVDGVPVPPMVMDYVTAMDRYVVLQLENEQDAYLGAKFAFQAARVFYDFQHNEESRRRFAWIVENYPEHEVAYLAGSLILDTLRQENDYAALAEWAERLGDVIEGEQAEAVRAEVREYRLLALFRSAEELFAQEKYEEAALEFARMAQDSPEHSLAPRALNNAASAMEVAGNYDEASGYYEKLFTEYPDHELVPRAVYRVAVNSEWLFDYDKAVRHYQLFYDEFAGPTPEPLAQLNFDIEENREESLLQIAQFQEFLQRYEDSARTFEEYNRTYPDSDFTAETHWAAAGAWEKAGNEREWLRSLRQYIDEYGDDPERAAQTMGARMKIANHHKSRGDERQLIREYEGILAEYDRWMGGEDAEPPPGQASMRALAAESKFMLVEREFTEWDNIRIQGSLQQQERLLGQKIEGVEKLSDEYRSVLSYQNLDWNLAAYFRIGNLLQRTAEELYEVPNPFDEGTDEFFVYQDALDDIAFPLEDAPIERYEETIDRARDNEIVNEWTIRTLAELHSFQPGNYPLYKEERRPTQRDLKVGIPLLSHEGYEARQRRQEWEDLEPEELDAEQRSGAGDEGDES